MRDDGILPAYVENASGELVIGRGYRNRFSHRLADQWIGRAFFWLVDHSRVANALYIRAKLSFLPADEAKAPPTAARDTCEELRASVVAQQRLWASGEPHWAARRVDRLLSDVPKLLHGKPAIFILRSFGLPDRACPAEIDLRARVVAQVRAKIEAAGIAFVDLDMAVLAKVGDQSGFRKLRGFGAKLGSGHLNPWGHEIYAEVLTDAITSSFSNLLHRDKVTCSQYCSDQK
jgi:hypothetical protein